ncbi:tetratricopeptide repeat protein [Streptomyces sp. 6N223]|uniref:tetratricopeptide repeat protein n=1 Tax=Streptomyces sp. 6N223 TaxID=3457412 RepID=UPI003FCF402B
MSPHRWPRWHRESAPADLARYAQRGVVSRLLDGVPAPSPEPAEERARRLFEAFAERGIRYAHASLDSRPGQQDIRLPDEVLLRPGHGTCLDLAVAYAGGCLDAGLWPLVAVLGPAVPGGDAHAVVIVWLDTLGEGEAGHPLRDVVHHTAPAAVLAGLAEGPEELGDFIAVDVARAAVGYATGAGGWAAAVAEGARLLRRLPWEVGVDIGLAHSSPAPPATHPVPGWPTRPVLREPYLRPEHAPDDEGPLRQIWARYGIVPFQRRGELERLHAWFLEREPQPRPQPRPRPRPPTRVALLYGPGGAGKTRLAAELATRLGESGWYAGFLERNTAPEAVEWLARVVSPLLVVVDYADDRRTEEITALLDVLLERTAPTCVLLTARTAGAWWEEDIAEERIGRAELRHPPTELTPRPPRPLDVYNAALAAFSPEPPPRPAPGPAPGPPRRAGGAGGTGGDDDGWGTLDLVMLAWLTARHGGAEPPRTPAALYEKILSHELRYWRRAFRGRFHQRLEPAVIEASAACVSFLAPAPGRVPEVLGGVPALSGTPVRRARVAAIITGLVPTPDPEGALFLQPDLLAEHLVLRLLGADEGLRDACLRGADAAELRNSCLTLTRAWQRDAETAERIAAGMLSARPDAWEAALQSSLTHNGPFIRPLEALARADGTPLPLDRLAHELPLGHGTVRRLALIAAERSVAPPATDPPGRDRRSMSLGTLAIRQAEAGQRPEALEAAREAVAIRRRLVASDATEHHQSNLAASLNTLANAYGGLGRYEEALTAVAESEALYRELVQRDAERYLADFTRVLTTRSQHLSNLGRHQEAADAATEVTALRRRLLGELGRGAAGGAAGPEAELRAAEYARSLVMLSVRHGALGRDEQAADAAAEAVGHLRALAETNPGTYLAELGGALHALAARLGDLGRTADAAAMARESVAVRREVAAHGGMPSQRADLARTLNTLSSLCKDAGRHEEAHAAAAEAVTHYRALAGTGAPAHMPGLAVALSTLAGRLGALGRATDAERTAAEAVDVARQVVERGGTAQLWVLAGALGSLARHRGALRHYPEAATAAGGAATHYRALLAAEGERHLPRLATTLTGLSRWLLRTGRAAEALDAARESVDHLRALSDRRPTLLPHLAMALNGLAASQEDADPEAALATLGEAVALFRRLARTDPGASRPRLATALTNQAMRLRARGRHDEAGAAAQEAVDIGRTLQDQPQLARSLSVLGSCLTALGRHEDACAADHESVAIRRRLARADPGRYAADLAASLNSLGVGLSGMDRLPEARAAFGEAVDILRPLAAERPETFGAWLATVEGNLRPGPGRRSAPPG